MDICNDRWLPAYESTARNAFRLLATTQRRKILLAEKAWPKGKSGQSERSGDMSNQKAVCHRSLAKQQDTAEQAFQVRQEKATSDTCGI